MLIVSVLLVQTGAAQPHPSLLKQKAPEKFRAVFRTTRGDITIEANRNWSPLGVDRLYQLIVSGFFNNTLFFRVEPGLVTQFGIACEPAVNRFWDPKKIKDEPRLQKNTKGTLAFARDGKDTRCTQLFFNNANNVAFDTVVRNGVKGYTPVARVVKGMEIAEKLNARYGRQPALVQDSLYKYGNLYFERKFPGLDKIIWARLVP